LNNPALNLDPARPFWYLPLAPNLPLLPLPRPLKKRKRKEIALLFIRLLAVPSGQDDDL